MGRVIERNECEACGEADGVCIEHHDGGVQVVRRYTDERYLLEMMKAARRVMHVLAKHELVDLLPEGADAGACDALEAALLWCESDGMGPVALSGDAQLELDHDVPERRE